MDFAVTGTLVWYYCVCPRQAWLMARHLVPDEDDTNIEIGRFIHETAYQREKKEIDLGNAKIDLFKMENGELVVGEVKKSSRHIKSARMQLLFYLLQLKEMGIQARGELLFPTEKKKEKVILDEKSEAEIHGIIENIKEISLREHPPPPVKIKYCRPCAYSEFCWS
jgi:CRISPR-associated exonuclease Cas4